MTRTRWSPKARLPDYLKVRGPFWPSLDPGPWSLALSKIPIQGKILILGDNQCNNKTAVMFSFAIFTPIVPGPSESVSSGAKKLPRNQNKIRNQKDQTKQQTQKKYIKFPAKISCNQKGKLFLWFLKLRWSHITIYLGDHSGSPGSTTGRRWMGGDVF